MAFEEDIELELISVPSGRFLMGSVGHSCCFDESPQHPVTVPAFWMGKYPVTQAQWKAVAALPIIDLELEDDPSFFKGDRRPVERVSWEDAIEFCARLSRLTGQKYRLPSEAEWEYACRAGTTTPFCFGETIDPSWANYAGSDDDDVYSPLSLSRQETTPVGRFFCNAFELYDMHGNVWEWCADRWHDNYNNAPSDGSAWNTGGDENIRVARGGSWDFTAWACRSAFRYWFDCEYRRDDLGFRVVREGR